MDVKQCIEQAFTINGEILSLTENALRSIRTDNMQKATLDEQHRYCKHLKSQLDSALKDIQQDLSNINNESFVFRKEKYSQILSSIKGKTILLIKIALKICMKTIRDGINL